MTTDDYCSLSKKEMAAEATACEWPNVPPSCNTTWCENVGESTALTSNIVFFVVFLFLFIVSMRMQWWSYLNHKKKKKPFWDKTGNEWSISSFTVVYFLR